VTTSDAALELTQGENVYYAAFRGKLYWSDGEIWIRQDEHGMSIDLPEEADVVRNDPADNKACNFAAVFGKYCAVWSVSDVAAYWDSDCVPVSATTADIELAGESLPDALPKSEAVITETLENSREHNGVKRAAPEGEKPEEKIARHGDAQATPGTVVPAPAADEVTALKQHPVSSSGQASSSSAPAAKKSKISDIFD